MEKLKPLVGDRLAGPGGAPGQGPQRDHPDRVHEPEPDRTQQVPPPRPEPADHHIKHETNCTTTNNANFSIEHNNNNNNCRVRIQ